MLHWLGLVTIVAAVILIALGGYLLLRTGFSLNGKPMRFDPGGTQAPGNNKSWYIEGVSAEKIAVKVAA